MTQSVTGGHEISGENIIFTNEIVLSGFYRT
jgi:hypothetical protein